MFKEENTRKPQKPLSGVRNALTSDATGPEIQLQNNFKLDTILKASDKPPAERLKIIPEKLEKEESEKPDVMQYYDKAHEYEPKPEPSQEFDPNAGWFLNKIVNADKPYQIDNPEIEAITAKSPAVPRWMKAADIAKQRSLGVDDTTENEAVKGEPVKIEEIIESLEKEAGFNILTLDLR